jgi:hemoglobin
MEGDFERDEAFDVRVRGSDAAFLALATAHHQRCLEDPVLSHPFSHPENAEHVARLANYWAEVFAGPPGYSESFGGHSAMLGIHAGQGADRASGYALRCLLHAGC